MRYLYSLVALTVMALISADTRGQNMVVNGDFEQYTICPYNGDITTSNVTGWSSYDGYNFNYYNPCASRFFYGVPSNFRGYQPAASGSAYAGAIAYNSSSTSAPSTYRYYGKGTLVPLTKGITYKVSMSLALSDYSTVGINKFGALFCDSCKTTILVPPYLYYDPHPQILYNDIVTDTMNWVRLSGLFVADSAYKGIIIGNYTAIVNPDTIGIRNGSLRHTEYYVDSVEVIPFTNIGIQLTDSLFCAYDTVKIPFVVLDSTLYSTNNVFSLLLSDDTGGFSSPLTLARVNGRASDTFICVIPATLNSGYRYRWRVIASTPFDSSAASPYVAIGNIIPGKPTVGSNSPICEPNALILSASSNTSGIHYKWDGPHNYFSTAQNPSIASTLSSLHNGAYIVTAVLYGCRSRDTVNVTVIPTIGVIGDSSNSPVCYNDTLKLYGSSAATSTIYSWSGPNGFTSGAKDTVIIHPSASSGGAYILTGFFSGCSSRDTINVITKTIVTSHSAGSNTPMCSGDTLFLSSQSTNSGVSFAWTGPSSFSSGTQNPVLFNVPTTANGRYIVSFTTGNGCFVYDTINVTVNQSPSVITASANTPLCQSDTLKLSATNSSSGVSWSWSGPASHTATTQNTYIANAQLTANGKYYVKATGSNGCYVRDSVDVTIKPQPQAFSASSNTPLCQGSALNLSANTTSTGATFSWAGPGSYSSASPSPAIPNAQPAHSGSYILTATLNGCSIKDTEVVNVVAIPATPVPQANTPVCIGQTLNLNAFGSGPSYLWSGPNSFTSTSATPSIANATSTVAGVYTVKAIDGACESAPGSVTVAVIAAPSVTMYPSPKDSICEGSTVVFSATASNAGTGATYKWYRNTLQEPGAFLPSYSAIPLADYDQYFCTVTSNGTCATPYTDSSNVIVMRVFPWLPASVSITSTATGTEKGGDLITFNAAPVNGGNFPKYQWKRNNRDVVGALSYTWGAKTLDDKDVICVEMSSSYLCPQPKTASSNCITVSINTTGIDDSRLMKGVHIYPNPVHDELVIEGISKGTRIQLFDVLGRVVVDITSAKEKEVLNTALMTKGNYLLLLTDMKGNNMNAKVVKN